MKAIQFGHGDQLTSSEVPELIILKGGGSGNVQPHGHALPYE
jgi:hypothetical protein